MSSHDCHRDATCMNMIGSFECHCNNGFTGDGRNCQSMDAEFIKAMANLHSMQIPETIVFLFYSSIYSMLIYHLSRIRDGATLYRQP